MDDLSTTSATLTYWVAPMTSSLEQDEAVLEPILDEFTATTGIEVDVEVVPWSTLWDRIMAAVSSGRGPDVLTIGKAWTASLQATGALLPFTDDVMDEIGGADRFVPVTLRSVGVSGEPPAAVPLYTTAYALFYNTTLFEAAGIAAPPDTWQEFVDDAKRLTIDTDGDGEPDQWGVSIVGGSGITATHQAFILGRQHGGSLFDRDGNPQFDSSAQVAAVRQYVSLIATEHVVAPGNAEYTSALDAIDQFVAGGAAMFFGQSIHQSVLADMGFADYAVAPLPVLDPLPAGGRDTRTFVGGANLAVFANTDHRDAALALVEFLTSPDVQADWTAETATLPVVTAAYDEDDLDDAARVFATILRDHAEPMPQVPEHAQMEILVGGAITDLMARAATGPVTEDDIRAALSEADARLTATR
ncbi:ABC transporter substrate-binding protein [Jiangella endophytica]|uniref:ABC transporter substrate-binding protein n=1 Tax=Jiangella endophytica TaxID=1623398 RepID=UPI0013007683|nr:sugar ABC transporter substrate-binding protein [Jiangella endophytica]